MKNPFRKRAPETDRLATILREIRELIEQKEEQMAVLNATEQAIITRLTALPGAVAAKVAAASSADNPDFITALESGLTTLEAATAPASTTAPTP